jgi:hypothetical protein
MGPLRFQGTISHVALGDIRVKPIRTSRLPEGDWRDLQAGPVAAGSFELMGRLSLSDLGASTIQFEGADPGDKGFQVILNDSGPGEFRTGSIKPGYALTTQHCFPGVPYDLRVLREFDGGHARVRVWLNDVLVSDADHVGAGEMGRIQWIPVGVPNTEVQVEHMLVRTL